MKKSIKMLIATIGMALLFASCNDSKLKVTTIDQKEKTEFTDYSIKLPQIEGVENEEINYFNLAMQESLRFIAENTSKAENDGLIKFANIDYKEHKNKFDVISLTVEASLSVGGAHPENVLDAYNINKKDEKLVTFAKAFSEDDVVFYNRLINDQIKDGKKPVKNTQGEDAHLFAEAEADIRNAVFYFEGDSVVFVFQQYMLGPYSSGKPVFKFSKSEMKGHLQLNK